MLSGGQFVGNNMTTGAYSFQVLCTDQGGCTATGFFTIQVDNPSPVLTSVSPAQLPVLSPALTLTLTGTGFSPYSVPKLSGVARPGNFISSTVMTMTLNPADVASVSNYAIRVDNPTPGGGSSSSKQFNVVQGTPPPTISVVVNGVSCGEYWQNGPKDSARVDFTVTSPDSIKLTFLYDFHSIIASSPSDPAGPLKLGPGTRNLSRTIHGLKTDSVYAFVISYITASMSQALLSNVDSCITPLMGVNELAKRDNQLTIFPNPLIAGSVAKVTFGSVKGILTLYDITSKQEVLRVEMKDGKAEIETGSLVSGVYLLKLESDENFAFGKLIVVH